jgi:DegV family protein with EDD domain
VVRIIADTTSGLPLGQAKELGIAMIPQIVIFGQQEYRDDTEIDTATFLDKLKASRALPKTAAPPPALYNPFYEEAAKRGEPLIVVAPSAKVSGTVRAAEIAAQDFPGSDIRIMDTLTIAGNLASLVLAANRLAREGGSADDIETMLKAMIPCGHIYFLLDTLEYLAKGGRIGGAKALLGELLQVKPILQIKDGQVEPFDQERTKKRATARLVEIVSEQAKMSAEPHLCVMEIDAREEAEALKGELAGRTGIQAIPIYTLPPAIVVHAGPKALAVGLFT